MFTGLSHVSIAVPDLEAVALQVAADEAGELADKINKLID
mgnify:CR=1 FL=1